MNLKSVIREIPDYPKKGILFFDVTTLFKNAEANKYVVDEIVKHCNGQKIDLVAGIESRGFILGGLIAHKLGVGFVPVRKKGKLPAETISETYEKEYGPDTLEMHKDAIIPGQKVLIVDDLLATGGTAKASAALIERLGGKVAGFTFIIELTFLPGRKTLDGYTVFSLVKYDSEKNIGK
ncbi:MAG: adenine phosphoribosyltransferase [Nanoarchaeota archaeon]|nr:adenine phosphoribosyltransferase [Nanoarchaeota archaeon]MBU4300070.1 adenine phosphoribosyltransferase [Nanoarchaeota archaeon]MCG2724393.1 adenine phosphoribosyltransferase [archaeon]